jgi:O-antigen ligase
MRVAQFPAASLMLAGSLCLLPFLLPYHQQPVLSFYPEWLAAALGAAAMLAALTGRQFPAASWPAAARWLVAFAAVLAAQAASGRQAYPQFPLLAALYVLYAVLLIWLGAQLAARLGMERVATVLAAFIVAGALANAVAGIVQFYGRPALLEGLIAQLRSGRAYGNIAQANLYADYLALGQSALILLWLRRRLPTAYALPTLVLLVVGGALSGSRSIFLYALWLAALGTLAPYAQGGVDKRRLRYAAFCVAGAAVAAHLAVPWLNGALQLGPGSGGALDRLLASSSEYSEPRWEVWLLALRVFASAPVFGVGAGSFAGAAFELGLDPSLARIGEVWTSPHNLPLHLLAETGALGAILALGGLCAWGWQVARRYRTDGQVALWWIIAAVGVVLIHSMVEYPLWNAHFLGVTALLMGVATTPGSPSPATSRSFRIATAAACGVLAVALALLIRDYLRLDATRIAGTTATLAPAADAQRDTETMRDLTHGLLAPLAEFWILMGVSLDRNDLAAKSAMSERVARFWPTYAVLARRAVFLALSGETLKAQRLIEQVMRTFPFRRDATLLILEQALAADRNAVEPLLAAAGGMRASPER